MLQDGAFQLKIGVYKNNHIEILKQKIIQWLKLKINGLIDWAQQRKALVYWKIVQQKNTLSTERNITEKFRKEHTGHIRHGKYSNILKIISQKAGKREWDRSTIFSTLAKKFPKLTKKNNIKLHIQKAL